MKIIFGELCIYMYLGESIIFYCLYSVNFEKSQTNITLIMTFLEILHYIEINVIVLK